MTDQPTNLLTWVGATDTCVSKNPYKKILRFFIGPRYTWGLIYGSECLSLSDVSADLTDEDMQVMQVMQVIESIQRR